MIWGLQEPHLPPLEKITVLNQGCLLDTITIHVLKDHGGWGRLPPLVCKTLTLRDVTVAEMDVLEMIYLKEQLKREGEASKN